MTPAELEKLVNEDAGVVTAGASVKNAKSKYDFQAPVVIDFYVAWQDVESEISNLKSFQTARKKQLRRSADDLKNGYFVAKEISKALYADYEVAVKVFDGVKNDATERIINIQAIAAAPEIAASNASVAGSNASSASSAAKITQINKDKIAEKLKANKKYIVWGLIGVVLVVVAIIVIKKFAK